MQVPAELKAGDRLHVKVPYPEKHNGIVASHPPTDLYRIVADNTNFFSGSKTGHLMYPAFDVADKLVSCLLAWLARWLTGWLVGWLVGWCVEDIQGKPVYELITKLNSSSLLLRFLSWVSSLAKRITGKKTTLTWNCQLL